MSGDGEQPDLDRHGLGRNHDGATGSGDDEPEGEGEPDLTLEEEVELRESMARIRRSVSPKLGSAFASLQQGGALARIARDMDRWKNLGRLPDSVFKGVRDKRFQNMGVLGIAGLSEDVLGKGVLDTNLIGKAFAERRLFGPAFDSARIAGLIPALSAEPAWLKQFKVIDSDAYKLAGIGQGNLTALSSILAKNADFGLTGVGASAIAKWADQQKALFANIIPKFDNLKFRFYPANLEAIEGLLIREVREVVMLDGIALWGVPRTEIAEKLIHAESAGARREILGRRGKAIAADCRAAMEACSSPDVARHVGFALSALDAYDAGNHHAAQALAASVLDTVVNEYFGKERYGLTPNRKTTTAVKYDEFPVRDFIAFAPMWQAYQPYRVENGDPIPRTFSRHATVHGVSARQFSKRNAVQGLLFVCSLLLFLDEEAVELVAA